MQKVIEGRQDLPEFLDDGWTVKHVWVETTTRGAAGSTAGGYDSKTYFIIERTPEVDGKSLAQTIRDRIAAGPKRKRYPW